MRCPTGLLDPGPLQDDLFQRAFARQDRNQQRLPPQTRKAIAASVLASPSAYAAAKAWIAYAYEKGPNASGSSKKKGRSPKKDALALLRDRGAPRGFTLRDTTHLVHSHAVANYYGRLSPLTVCSDSDSEEDDTSPAVDFAPKVEPSDTILTSRDPNSSSTQNQIHSANDSKRPQTRSSTKRKRSELEEPAVSPAKPSTHRSTRNTRPLPVKREVSAQPIPLLASRPRRACTIKPQVEPVAECEASPARKRRRVLKEEEAPAPLPLPMAVSLGRLRPLHPRQAKVSVMAQVPSIEHPQRPNTRTHPSPSTKVTSAPDPDAPPRRKRGRPPKPKVKSEPEPEPPRMLAPPKQPPLVPAYVPVLSDEVLPSLETPDRAAKKRTRETFPEAFVPSALDSSSRKRARKEPRTVASHAVHPAVAGLVPGTSMAGAVLDESVLPWHGHPNATRQQEPAGDASQTIPLFTVDPLLPSSSVADARVDSAAMAEYPLLSVPLGADKRQRVKLEDIINDPDTGLHRLPVEADSEIVKRETVLALDVPAPLPEPSIIHGVYPKAPLLKLPPFWTQSRQEMCESSEWFKSYQAGIYHKGGVVKGYFLSGFGAIRDCWQHDGKLVVSHGGGKSESLVTSRGARTKRLPINNPLAANPANAPVAGQAHKQKIKPASDQSATDKSVSALLRNYATGQPIALLIDDKYAPFPYDLSARGVYMAFLGFYRIVDVWAEYQPDRSHPRGAVVRYKFAFQWCESQGQPWWFAYSASNGRLIHPDQSTANNDVAVSPLPFSSEPPPTASCSTCGFLSPRVYAQGWACLRPECPRFFHHRLGDDWVLLPCRATDLDYNPGFLALKNPSAWDIPPGFSASLSPPEPNTAPVDGVMTDYASTRGWHCRSCGRLSCRSAWEHYECPNCKAMHKITASIRPAAPLINQAIKLGRGFVDESYKVHPRAAGVEILPTRTFLHASANNEEHLGSIQTFVLPDNRGKIHLIRTNPSMLFEADQIFEAYQTQAFDGRLVFRRYPLKAHKLRGPMLTSYFSQNSGEVYRYVGGTDNTVPFDRAPGAVLQARDLIQKRIREALDDPSEFNEILSAAYMEQQQMGFHTDSEPGLGPVVAGLSMGSPALMKFRLALKYTPADSQRFVMLEVVLRHGDVCVMDGADVQEYYEHTVIPSNFRIAATARWISPEQHALPAKQTRRRPAAQVGASVKMEPVEEGSAVL
ncbi:2OG-FeII-Oxy-2 domain-containing protein [Mycena chlorophos]|uniref:2OG-FeII-Oxy-2 domain-containing protein n=1 Tax=Mycena chlorophos TaxID=658473 RepID=A0A8H6S7P3_MYCCL|nr:2OG-FeII-Oxy-2 domain-containing protein [Mycena chlorophos]